MDNYNPGFGKRIKYARRKISFNQEKLAQAIGVSTGSVGGYETAKSYPSVEVLIKIAKVCNVSIDWLIRGEGESDYELETASSMQTPSADSLLQQKLQQMEESFRKKEQQYLEIIRNLSLGKARVIEILAAVLKRVTGSVTHQRNVLALLAIR